MEIGSRVRRAREREAVRRDILTSLMASVKGAERGGRVVYFAATRQRAIEARDAVLPGRRGFVHKLGKGTLRFAWIGMPRAVREGEQPMHVVIDECTDIDDSTLAKLVGDK